MSLEAHMLLFYFPSNLTPYFAEWSSLWVNDGPENKCYVISKRDLKQIKILKSYIEILFLIQFFDSVFSFN